MQRGQKKIKNYLRIQMEVNSKKPVDKGTNQLFVLHCVLSDVFSHALAILTTNILKNIYCMSGTRITKMKYEPCPPVVKV